MPETFFFGEALVVLNHCQMTLQKKPAEFCLSSLSGGTWVLVLDHLGGN